METYGHIRNVYGNMMEYKNMAGYIKISSDILFLEMASLPKRVGRRVGRLGWAVVGRLFGGPVPFFSFFG